MSSSPPSDDDERTVVRPSFGGDSQLGGFVTSSSFLGHTLPEGTVIGGLEITGLIGEGGFGIVYLAYDSGLQRQVAIKEYMPSSLAARATNSMDVQVKSERHADTFKAGLKSFVNEARLLAKFDHDSLVKVFRFWEANGTAYMAMPYYEGPTLKRALAEMITPPDEAQLRAWLHPILDALAVMHHAHCFHRDIAPDNILLTASGPLLLDFGAARRVIGDMTHALTVVLKPGYAPIEQYGDSPNMAQGSWTDLYALACVVYYAITGKAPMSSVERLMGDRLQPLSRLAAGRYSEGFLRAIDAALGVRPQERPQDVAQFRALLDAELPLVQPAPAAMPSVLPGGAAAPPQTPAQRTAQLHAEERTHPMPLRDEPQPPAARTAPRPATAPPPPVAPATWEPTQPGPLPEARQAPAPPATAAPPRIERTAWAAEPAVLYRDESKPAPVPAKPAPPPRPVLAPPPDGEPRDMRPYVIGGGVAVLLLSIALLYNALRTHAPETPVIAPAEPAASAVAAPASAAIVVPPVVPQVVRPKPPEVVPATPEVTPGPETAASAPPLSVPPTAASVAVAAPATSDGLSAADGEPKPKPKPARPPVEIKKPAPKPQLAETPPPKPQSRPARCSDILQKASLETLNAEEAAFLRRECR